MKKAIPLAILQTLQPFVDNHIELIEAISTKETIFKLKDRDKKSDFYFEVVRQELANGNPGYIIEFKPTSKDNVLSSKQWTKLESIIAYANNWVKLIKEYNSIQTIYDDPIEKQYQEEFYNDFKIVDEDATTSRFNFSQQIILLTYIEKIENYINEDTTEFTEEDKLEILKETKDLKQELATETKDNFIQKQTSIWAKIRKKSIKACEFTIKEFAKVVIKSLAEKGMTISWDALPHYIDHIKGIMN